MRKVDGLERCISERDARFAGEAIKIELDFIDGRYGHVMCREGES